MKQKITIKLTEQDVEKAIKKCEYKQKSKIEKWLDNRYYNLVNK